MTWIARALIGASCRVKPYKAQGIILILEAESVLETQPPFKPETVKVVASLADLSFYARLPFLMSASSFFHCIALSSLSGEYRVRSTRISEDSG